MQVSIENPSALKRVLTITVPSEDVQKAYKKAFIKVAKNAKIDGFRKGHIPTSILESHYGDYIVNEAVDNVVGSTVFTALVDNKIEFLEKPEISFKEDFKFQKDGEFTYLATVEVKPEVDVQPYADLAVTQIKCELSDQDVEDMIQTLRQQQATWTEDTEASEAKEDSRVIIDFKGFTKEENGEEKEFDGGSATDFSLTLNEGSMIPGFSEQIVGHKKGETFDINVKFPDNYHAENLKGKDAKFTITLHSISKKVLPELDENFIKKFGIKDGNIDTFKAELKKNMLRELRRTLYINNRDRLFDAIVKNYADKFELPQCLIQNEIAKLKEQQKATMARMGLPADMVEKLGTEHFEPKAKNLTVISLVLQAMIAKEGFKEASQKSIDDEIEMILGAYEDPEQVRKSLEKDSKQMQNIKSIAFEREICEKLIDLSKKDEETLTFKQVTELRPQYM